MRELVRLVSTARRGLFYVASKSRRTMAEKRGMEKFSTFARKPVELVEAETPSGGKT